MARTVFGQRDETADHEEPPRLPLEDLGRNYVLYQGTTDAASIVQREHGYLPDIWWPDDRVWVFTTDVDLDSAFLAGPTALVQELVESREVEAVVTWPDHRIA